MRRSNELIYAIVLKKGLGFISTRGERGTNLVKKNYRILRERVISRQRRGIRMSKATGSIFITGAGSGMGRLAARNYAEMAMKSQLSI